MTERTKPKKTRLDIFLVDRGFFPSREQAQRAIMAGEVRVGETVVDKASAQVAPDATVLVDAGSRYVGRGGIKLEGAKKVYAIDVGHGQLAWKIRNNPRVVVREKLNARFLGRADVPEPVDLCVIDVSFISLTLILPNAFELVTPNGMILALIKPQFELEASDVGRGGIVREPALHIKAQEKIRQFVVTAGHEMVGIAPSEITGTDGNQEFFACVRKRSA